MSLRVTPQPASPGSFRPPAAPSTISQLAQNLFQTEQPSAPLNLVGAGSSEQYNEAKRLFSENNKVAAKAKFLQILATLPEPTNALDFIFRAACRIGVARCCVEDRPDHLLEAKLDLDKAYERAPWEEDQPGETYQELRRNLTRLDQLTPANEVLFKKELGKKIQHCADSIPPLVYFREKLAEADHEAQKPDNLKKTVTAYQEALKVIDGKEGDEFIIERTLCLMKWALAFPAESSERNQAALTAKVIMDDIFGKLAHFESSEENLELIAILFARFYQLLSDANKAVYFNELKSRWDTCVQKLNTLNPSKAIAEFPKTIEDLKKIMKEPADKSMPATPKEIALNLERPTPIKSTAVRLSKPRSDFQTPEDPTTPVTSKPPAARFPAKNKPAPPASSVPTKTVASQPPERSNISRIFAIFVLLAAAATAAVVYYRHHYEKID